MIVGRGRAACLALALATIGCYPAGAPGALPSSDITVVVTGGNEFNGKTLDHRKLLVEQLIPAVSS